MITASILKAVAPQAKTAIAEAAAPVFAEWWPRIGVTTKLRQAHFLAQFAHEVGARASLEENLRYTTVGALTRAFGRRIPRDRAHNYLRNPEALANLVYARADLGNTQPGDGWRFRGRGLFQLTGRANYSAFTKWVREHDPAAPDFVAEPQKLAEFPWAAVSACWYWQSRPHNAVADRDDIEAVTRLVNGGRNGLADRIACLVRAKAALADPVGPEPIEQGATLRKGNVGDRVRTLQSNLVRLGSRILVDQHFGDQTELAVKAFQAVHGLVPDGIVGPKTAAAIVEALAAKET